MRWCESIIDILATVSPEKTKFETKNSLEIIDQHRHFIAQLFGVLFLGASCSCCLKTRSQNFEKKKSAVHPYLVHGIIDLVHPFISKQLSNIKQNFYIPSLHFPFLPP